MNVSGPYDGDAAGAGAAAEASARAIPPELFRADMKHLRDEHRRLLIRSGLLRRLGEGARRPVPAAAEPELPPLPSFRQALDALSVPAALMHPVLDGQGRPVDVATVAVNEAAEAQSPGPSGEFFAAVRRGPVLSCRTYPGFRATGLVERVAETARTGRAAVPWTAEWLAPWTGGRVERRLSQYTAVPCGSYVLTTFRRADTAVMAEEAERVTRTGWALWDLIDGHADFSPGMFDLMGMERGDSALDAESFLDLVAPESRALVHGILERLLNAGEVAHEEVDLRINGRTRRMRMVVEPVRTDSRGPVVAVRMVARDVTEIAAARHRLEQAALDADRQRQRADAEAETVARLRDALMPRTGGALAGAGVSTAVTYRPAAGSQVGGDWYKVRRLPDGRVLLAIGDARGHGLDAVALMSQLRHALAGLAYTGARVEDLGRWLNRIAWSDGPESTATAVIAHYHPERRLLRWICVGHPWPVLYRAGRSRLLEPDTGPALGVLPDSGYRAMETWLQPGDRVLLYTDGLIEQRGADPEERMARLAEAVEEAAKLFEDQQQRMDALLRRMAGDCSEDDATLLSLRVDTPAEPPSRG